MLGNNKFPSSCWEYRCTCWSMPLLLSQAVNNCAFPFTFCLCRASRSIRDESLESFQVFPKYVYRLGDVLSLIHVCDLLDSQKFIIAFQSSVWISYSPAFPSKSFYCSTVCPMVIHCPRQLWSLKKMSVIV